MIKQLKNELIKNNIKIISSDYDKPRTSYIIELNNIDIIFDYETKQIILYDTIKNCDIKIFSFNTNTKTIIKTIIKVSE